MDTPTLLAFIANASYFLAAVLFILGIKRMSSPVTARSGIQWAGVGVLVAVIATFFHSGMHNVVLMLAAIRAAGVADPSKSVHPRRQDRPHRRHRKQAFNFVGHRAGRGSRWRAARTDISE